MNFPLISHSQSEIEESKTENIITSYQLKNRDSRIKLQDEENKSNSEDDMQEKSIRTLSDIPSELGIADIKRFKSMSMESRININNKSRTIGWIMAQLEEMGFEADPRIVRLTMRAYPPGTSKSFILETIVKDILRDEEESNSENMPESTRSANRLRESEVFGDRGREETFCRMCYIMLDMDDKYRVFACQDAICRNCIFDTFKTRIEENENIEHFRCPDSECNRAILVDKFVNLIPEADQKDVGSEELGNCNICLEQIIGSEDLLKISKCQEHFYCYKCTLAYLKECINNRKVIDIKCPDAGCTACLDEEKIQELLPKYLSQRYTRFKKIAMIERNPNIRWCSKPGCEEVLDGNLENPNLQCKCGQITCFICGNPNHTGKSCEQALEEEYKAYATRRDLQFCPECKSRVEKMEGCNHMTCPICTYEWCWLCKREYAPGHFDPLNPLGCPGLMAGENTRQNQNRMRLFLRRFLIFMLYILGIITSPIWIVVIAVMLPNLWYEPRPAERLKKVASIRFLLFIIGLILFPLTITVSIIGAIIPGSCILGSRLLEERRTRSEAKRRRKELIQERDARIRRGEHFLLGFTAVEEGNPDHVQIDFSDDEDLSLPLLNNRDSLGSNV